MIKRIAITGPECTGKSTLAKDLAEHFKTVYVPEVARFYIDALDRPYTHNDLLEIAKLQCAEEDKLIQKANKFLICDTDLLVIKIWSVFKYGSCDRWILDELIKRKNELYLLCNINLKWQQDSQREHPDARQELFDIYHHELLSMKASYEIITGSEEERTIKAITVLEKSF
jgi:NadR type nicotinamide-nucleotide adenylyltransferase